MIVKASLPSREVEFDLVTPEFGVVVESPLDKNKNNHYYLQEINVNLIPLPLNAPWPGILSAESVVSRVFHIMLNVSHYYANSLCSTNATIMLK